MDRDGIISRLLFIFITATSLVLAQESSVLPSYITAFAPIVFLDVNELFLPGDIGAQLIHTYPALNFTNITSESGRETLSNLSQLNSVGHCNVNGSSQCYIYLTSRDDVPVSPPSPDWLYGVLPNSVTGETVGAKSAVVVVVDHGNGLVDGFYFYFYPFNLGLLVNGVVYDDHVGDWEHNMIRFQDGQPQSIWYSQHSGGECYTYTAVMKNGTRPLVFSSLGGHASYAVPGIHVMYNGLANDTTSYGPLWDPVLSAYFYLYTPDPSTNTTTNRNGTFTTVSNSSLSAAPTDWLYYLGKWGDKQYPANHTGQNLLGTIAETFEDGPTGPIDKDLYRQNPCPDSQVLCIPQSVLPSISGSTPPQTVTRTHSYSSATSTATTGSTTNNSATSQRSTKIMLCLGLLIIYLADIS